MNIVLQGNNDENLLRILNKSIYETIDDYIYEKYSNENTISSYRSYITRHVRKVDFQKLQDLNHIHYIDIRKSIVAFIKSFSSANTKRVVISCLRGFWNYLCDVYGYKKNPVPAKMNLPPRQSKSITKSLTFDKIKHLLDKLQSYTKFGFCDHVKYVLTATLATTGLRISEVLQITTSMVEEGCISIVQKRGKTRKLELPPQTQKALWDFICLYDIKGGVFQTSTRQVMGRVYAHRIVKKATGISPHGFRKSVIEMLIDKGIHNHEVAKVSGHSSINMVFYYDNRDTVAEAHKGLAMDLLKQKIIMNTEDINTMDEMHQVLSKFIQKCPSICGPCILDYGIGWIPTLSYWRKNHRIHLTWGFVGESDNIGWIIEIADGNQSSRHCYAVTVQDIEKIIEQFLVQFQTVNQMKNKYTWTIDEWLRDEDIAHPPDKWK